MAENDAPQGGTSTLTTPGDNDLAVTGDTNPTTEQVTSIGGEAVPAEGQKIREQARKNAEERGIVSLTDVVYAGDVPEYDENGQLVNSDGKKIALAADAFDPETGWTVQHAGAHQEKPVAYPGGYATVPDQTFHPDELPDPTAAVRAGLLPQPMHALNIDPEKFAGKKSLEP